MSKDRSTHLTDKAGLSIRAENEYMQTAIDEALYGITHRHGGPFGCVIVKDGEIVARAHNQVLLSHDPTSHGEIRAIRAAGKALKTHDLSGCELYTTGEPCPMCMCACMWANIDRIYYGCSIEDNAHIGFRDAKFYQRFQARDAFSDYLTCIDKEACRRLFDVYADMVHTGY